MAFLIAALTVTAIGFSLPGKAGPYLIELTTEPTILPVGKAALDIFLTDASGKPVEGATIRAIAQMPNMAMGEREQTATPSGLPGHYRFSQSFSMAGAYEAKLAVNGPLGKAMTSIPMETGKSTAAATKGGAPDVLGYWPWLAGFAVVAFVVVRMRRTGLRVDAKAVLNRQVVGALVVLGIVVAGALYAVNNLRRSGSMTPIEAQTMSMEMPPPEGITPVTLATVVSRPFSSTVQYSGQAVGYDTIDVGARTTGVVVWMPGYVGTAVRKGEVIARLDTSQLGPQVDAQRATVESARQGVGVAQAETRQADAMIHQAESELGQFQGAVGESKANLSAAKDDREAAKADLASAQADVRDAQASASSAQANQQYWSEELKRETSLLAAGAVSRDEYEKEKAEAAKADAEAHQANETVRSAEAKVGAAQARVRKADSMVVAAERKIDQAQSALMAHHAHVLTAKAEASSARQKVGQAQSGVRQAQAGLSGTVAQASYAEIRAETDGVITERIVSPGTLVAPGQTLLRIARVEPIRIQVNVPESDLAEVRIGQIISIVHRDASETPLVAKVTAVAPSVDPTSRMGIVEAILPNTGHAYLPGQYISMRIALGGQATRIVIPAAAFQSSASSGNTIQAKESSSFVWTALPVSGQEGHFTVTRKSIIVGPSEGDSVAVLSGLAEGDKVVVTGAAGLVDGQTVTFMGKETASVPATATPVVTITESGFVPSTLTVSAGSRKVTFLRKTDNTCAKEVVFNDLKIRRDLPLNVAVTIDLPANASGELRYACGMDMLKGSVVVR